MIVLRLISPFPTFDKRPLAYHFCLVESRELECFFKDVVEDSLSTTLLRSTTYTAQVHYNHDIALVDQGGTRPTF